MPAELAPADGVDAASHRMQATSGEPALDLVGAETEATSGASPRRRAAVRERPRARAHAIVAQFSGPYPDK